MSFRDKLLALRRHQLPEEAKALRVAVCLAAGDTDTSWVADDIDIFSHIWDGDHRPSRGYMCAQDRFDVGVWLGDLKSRRGLPWEDRGHPAAVLEVERLYSIMYASHCMREHETLHGFLYDIVVMGSHAADMSRVVVPRPNTLYGSVTHHRREMAFGVSTDFFFADSPTFHKAAQLARYLPVIGEKYLRIEAPTSREAMHYHCCQIGIEVEPL